MDVGTIVVSVVGALVSGTGGAAVVTALARRKVTEAEAVGSLTDSALDLLNAAKEEASEARAEAREARKEAHETRVQMRHVREEADHIVNYLRRVVRLIHDPTMTMERLRVLVGEDPPNGGVSRRT